MYSGGQRRRLARKLERLEAIEMVQCYLCKGKLRVTRDKHLYDEKLKKRYHLKCFAGICRVCDKPVYSKSKHKVIGSNVWHAECYKTAHRHNPIKTIDDASYKAMEDARKAADIPRKLWHEFKQDWFKEHLPGFKEGDEGVKRSEGRRAYYYWETKSGDQYIFDFVPALLAEAGHDIHHEITVKAKNLTEARKKLKEELKRRGLPNVASIVPNPRRPTKEFWDKHYPEVLAQYKKKYPKKEAEERAGKATAAIWYDTMGPKKKAKYEAIRRKREARNNPQNKTGQLLKDARDDIALLEKKARDDSVSTSEMQAAIDDHVEDIAGTLESTGLSGVGDIAHDIRQLTADNIIDHIDDIEASVENLIDESIRRKREARENPDKYLLFMENEKNAEGISEIKTKKLLWRDEYSRDRLATLPDLGDQIPEDGRWVIPDNKHNRSILRTRGVRFQTWETPTTAEIMGDLPKYRKIVEEDMKENPPKDIERFEKDLLEVMKTSFLIYETRGLPATTGVSLMSMRPVPVQKDTHSVTDTPEHRRMLDDLDVSYKVLEISPEHAKMLIKELLKKERRNPAVWVTKWTCPVHGVVPESQVYGDEFGPKYHYECGQQVEETEMEAVRGEEGETLYYSQKGRKRKQAVGNPTLVTPEQETDIVGAFQRVIHGIGTEADKLMVRMAREADVVMSTGPSVMLKRNPEEPLYNPKDTKVDYIIQDEFGTVFETGKGTGEEAESRALHYNKKYMREFKVIYPKGESSEVKKAAQTATREMLKD
jgi:hypothetical protein